LVYQSTRQCTFSFLLVLFCYVTNKFFFFFSHLVILTDLMLFISSDTHTHPFNGRLSRTTRVSQYQKGKTNLDFTEARDSEWQWHQLGRVQVCTSLQTDNHASTPPLIFTARCYASAVLAMALCLSVRLSVRPSVTSRCSTKTAKRRITQTTHDSPGTLLF